jgi:F-type H+-transporting ATPase subunit delta
VAEKDALVRGYAEALLAIAEAEGDLATVEDELYTFAKALETNTRLREAMTDAALPADRKRAVLEDLLGERANPHTVNIIAFILEQGRARELGRIIEQLAAVAAERRRKVVAEVRSAVPLDETRRTNLAKALSKATGREVEVKVVVDPGVLGGIVARIGDEVFDGSIQTRLREARDLLGA